MAAEKTNMPTQRVKASTSPPGTAPSGGDSTNFIRTIVEEDFESGKWGGRLMTRFPPEPNGYLHLGHAKSICLNFGLARDYDGRCNLRFDDTDPSKESIEYVDSIKADVRWLGFEWEDREYYASDYFEQLFEYAVELIKKGKAYIDSLPPDQIRRYRGTLTEPGQNSPYRERSVEENLDLFYRMKAGEFGDGAHVLRAKIDMAAPNLLMRDPTLFRIKHVSHYRTGDQWCIYPMYDFTHCLSDSIEGVTHSLCTLEFEINRELYDWILDQLEVYHPQQIEFARLNLTYTVLSKRKLIELVTSNLVDGWDDPRMPTLSGIRRRGYSPAAIRNFCDRIGVAKSNSVVDIALLEYCLREDLNKTAPRVMAVLNPLKLVIDNYPDDSVEMLEAENNPEDPAGGSRQIPFSKVLYVERDDFRETPPRKWFRLAPGKEVRLKHAYYITCNEVVTDPQTGDITELHCTYDPATKGGWSEDGRKVKGTLHWVSASQALPADVYLYDRLFLNENPDEAEDGRDFKANLNPDSLTVLRDCRVEPSLANAESGQRFQFLRLGYFCVDSRHTQPDRLVFNRTVTLRDSWAKIEKTLK